MLMQPNTPVGVVMPFDGTPWKIVNAALFALVAAEGMRHIVVPISHHRGWHG